MKIEKLISQVLIKGIPELYGQPVSQEMIQLQKTNKEFEGDITLVVFPLLKISGKSPEATGQDLGVYLENNIEDIIKFIVYKGFLNMVVSDRYYLEFMNRVCRYNEYGFSAKDTDAETVMVEFSSPNTNKPLHLGHIRNNLLGNSVCNIIKAAGKKVVRTNLVNDRGIHICKSMLAWQKWGNGETPESAGKKGDHLVGDYYVMFDQQCKLQVADLISQGKSRDEAEKTAPLMLEVQEMLRKWESGDAEVYALWKTMNDWVYEGFEETYRRLGIGFDKIYYESDTYLVGRDTVLEGLKNGLFYRHKDGSVWVDLKTEGLDEKVLLRADGTSVYITQDIGTAQERKNDFHPDRMVYVVGNEQNYHFKVLRLVLDKLGFSWAKTLYHLSYGMVELPEGKMKSREGTVVDADDLMDEMIKTAREMSYDLGKLEKLSPEEKEDTFTMIGLGALKYYILKVDPVKNMTFNPRESIDFDGNTGPFIQYTHARIKSVFRKAEENNIKLPEQAILTIALNEKEKNIMKITHDFPEIIINSAETYNPSLIANFIYDLAKEYNQFYHDFSILKEPDPEVRAMRLMLSDLTAKVINSGMGLLGIQVPDRM
ncbi:MAG: arginine--tRNA ligase [Bacteroidales bacterium]|nr:arginine--tRNA ligase [Bacteroidales bacterium]MBN2763193.1 arginine--tRNA ligase [Bacteroidales bacterium]